MQSKRVNQDLKNTYLSVLVGSYLIERFNMDLLYSNPLKEMTAKRLVLIGASVWSLASAFVAIIEYLNTAEGDTALRESFSQDSGLPLV